MIIFATAYDEATTPNHRMARMVLSPDDTFLEKEEATRGALHTILGRTGGPMFAFSHGTDELLLAQGGKLTDAALTHEDALGALLRGRPVFAHACKTARVLGRAAATSGSLWWGYLEKVTAPSDIPGVAEILCELFKYVKASFACQPERSLVDLFFEGLRERCDAAKYMLDEISESDPNLPLMEAYLLITELESKLVAWVPGAAEPYNPPLASP